MANSSREDSSELELEDLTEIFGELENLEEGRKDSKNQENSITIEFPEFSIIFGEIKNLYIS
jgi:hypothetical protein